MAGCQKGMWILRGGRGEGKSRLVRKGGGRVCHPHAVRARTCVTTAVRGTGRLEGSAAILTAISLDAPTARPQPSASESAAASDSLQKTKSAYLREKEARKGRRREGRKERTGGKGASWSWQAMGAALTKHNTADWAQRC